jgi:DNA polymerase kappa
MELDEEEVHDTMEDNMPGFHEHDETDYKLKNGDNDNDEEVINLIDLQEDTVSNPRQPPHSTGNPIASSSKPATPRTPAKRRNSDAIYSRAGIREEDLDSSVQKLVETHECPICGKTLETDNDGLNAHIDFCLSRGAILEAQVEASKSSSMPPKKFTGWPKPESIKKAETAQLTTLKGKRAPKRGK